mmetsp:Transcript_21291/g.44340  ORF Transcript_21291/g.44340 Transcript_21291/m.44340 type:complete len:369 (+) Transcript_21291:39-1145(+)
MSLINAFSSGVVKPLKITPDTINLLINETASTSTSSLSTSSPPTLVKLAPSSSVLSSLLFKKELQGTTEDSDLISYFFTSCVDLEITSESGAEYSYYNVTVNFFSLALKTFLCKVGLGSFLLSRTSYAFHSSLLSSPSPLLGYKAEVISPASERQIQRSMPTKRLIMVKETKQLYEDKVKPHIESILKNERSLSWLWNVLDKKKEVERILLDEPDFLMNVDTKWGSHAPMFTNGVPKGLWKMEKNMIDDLYCLAILQERGVATLRDLRSKHVPVLRDIAVKGRRVIEEVYGVPPEEIRVFIHYHPQFYHLHIHFTRLWNDIGCQVERAHLLDEVIINLEQDDQHYANKTIFYKLNEGEKLAMVVAAPN